ncbi:helix-turn-helix domain-containing protein [Lysinibacillus piscis]|uniref:Transcriptional regulator n=1 Tax=Lysinibacillus piscis TaxID=2518931 RepID=A0ABQ5NLZ4_9BACI|nr:helix-turn-helix transcriptional regulator [Lysinibacillus sp. KH24]GLC89380.1 transcriptional regulator [Lysinibacillus sp. KH24]
MTAFDILKKLCDEQGISVNTLEEKIGLGKNTLYSWKKNTPKGSNLIRVADYFQVSTDYLLGRSEEKRTFNTALEHIEEDIDIRTLNRMAKDMTPNQRKKAIRVLEATFEDLFDDED